eukprot:2601735-Amphidinium_carterae.2
MLASKCTSHLKEYLQHVVLGFKSSISVCAMCKLIIFQQAWCIAKLLVLGPRLQCMFSKAAANDLAQGCLCFLPLQRHAARNWSAQVDRCAFLILKLSLNVPDVQQKTQALQEQCQSDANYTNTTTLFA